MKILQANKFLFFKTKFFSIPKFNFTTSIPNILNQNKSNIEKPKLRILSDSNQSSISFLPQTDIPLCIFPKSSKAKPDYGKTFNIVTPDLKYSAYKLNDSCRKIRRRTIENALEVLESDITKGSSIIKEQLNDFIQKEKKRNEYDKYVYKIVLAYVGKKNGHKLPSPRAKGKTDIIVRSLSKLYLVIQRISQEEYLKQASMGKADFTYAHNVRRFLFMTRASPKLMRAYSFITTSRGRYYRKQQYTRFITMLRNKYYQEKGIKLSTDIIALHAQKYLGRELLGPGKEDSDQIGNIKDTVQESLYQQLESKLLPDKYKPENKDEGREQLFNKNYKKI